MSARHILVTGGAGYVGSHACKALAEAGWVPVTYDNLGRGHEWAVRWGPLERGDILDRARLDEVLARWAPEAVMHFAAFAYVGESVREPEKYQRNNVAGSATLLDAARAHGVMRFVFSSSCAVYGAPERSPMNEDHPLRPLSPYGQTKLAVEGMLADRERAEGVRSACLRYFNAAGADPEGAIGEWHDPETHLIPLALDAALGRGPALTIHGDDYATADGTCVRDYVHVGDLARAHLLALDHLLGGKPSLRLNLGAGRGTSVREVLRVVETVVGRPVPFVVGPRREGDAEVLVADATRASAVLGWRPTFPGLDQQIEHAARWARERAAVAGG